MTVRQRVEHQEPDHVRKWVGKRVKWGAGKTLRTGLVIDAGQVRSEDGTYLGLRIARDDGFVDYGVDSDNCIIVTQGGSE